MTIKEMRKKIGWTQKRFSEELDIPKRTIEDWDAEKSNPPVWVENLLIEKLEKIMEEDKMKLTLTEKDIKMGMKLLDYMSMDADRASAIDAFKHDYLTINNGLDGKTYVSYLDESHLTMMEIDGCDVIEDEETIVKILGLD